MAAQCQQVKVTEKAWGFRLDITGPDLAGALACFLPSAASAARAASKRRNREDEDKSELPYPIEALIEPIIRRMQ